MVRPFELLGNPVSVQDQMENASIMQEADSGWVAIITGQTEPIKLFAYSFMHDYLQVSQKVYWHHVSSSKWDMFIDAKERPDPHLLVLDCLLTHPATHPEGFRQYDPTRIGKIFDIVSMYRGVSSIIVLAPEILPEDAYKLSNIQAEFYFNIRYRARDLEI